MHFRPLAAGLCLTATFAAGCLTGRGASGADSPRAMLERTAATYDHSTSTRDPNDVVRLFRPDVVVLSPQSREPAVGVDVNRAAWARFFALPKAEHSIATRELVVSESGDLAYTRGSWTANFERPDGSPTPGSGELVTIWRRDPSAGTSGAGEWRVAVVMAHRVR